MKDSLIDIVGEDAMKREFPDQLLVRKKSDKILAKLMGECVECHKQQEKNQMVSITARTKRGGKHLCVYVQTVFRKVVQKSME